MGEETSGTPVVQLQTLALLGQAGREVGLRVLDDRHTNRQKSPYKNGPRKNGPAKSVRQKQSDENGPAEKTVLLLLLCVVIRVYLPRYH